MYQLAARSHPTYRQERRPAISVIYVAVQREESVPTAAAGLPIGSVVRRDDSTGPMGRRLSTSSDIEEQAGRVLSDRHKLVHGRIVGIGVSMCTMRTRRLDIPLLCRRAIALHGDDA